MSSVVISGDTSGAITLAAPAVSGTNTATLPAATGTVMVSGNMPAFSYYASSGTSMSAGTYTKILFQTQEFDTASAVSSSKFTPQVAGYYLINSAVNLTGSTSAGYGTVNIYKNGSIYKQGSTYASTASSPAASISSIVYCNGSTDYIEIYALTPGSITSGTGQAYSWFNGALMRAA
jgi:hypothetical protein